MALSRILLGPLSHRLSPAGRGILRVGLVVFALALLALGAGFARLELRILRAGAPPPTDVFVLPAPDAARLIAARYTEAAADAVWTRMLVYYGEQFTRRNQPKNLHAYMDALTSLDPYFRSPYAWGGYAVVFADPSGVPRADDMEYSFQLLRLGIARFPDDAELMGILGYNLFYELPRWIQDPDTILRSKVEGAEYLRRQAAIGGGPPWLALSAATALQDLNFDDLAARHLEESAQTVDDPVVRSQILFRLARLRANIDTESIRLATDTLLGIAKRETPYLPPSMFLLLSSPEAQARMAVGLTPEPFVEDSR